MSFLLLKSRRNQPPLPQAPTGFRPNRGSSNHLVPRNPVQSAPAARSFSRGGQMQQQVQIQRPKSTISNLPRQAIPRQTQRIQQVAVPKQQQQQQQQEKASGEVQGVISMDEVMEDLRVLEQQQRDSQRKLATIKMTKQHRVEQRVSLENRLSQLKYGNGEQRAQLLRSRHVLSKSTRELSKARLGGGRAAADLKTFDDRLKKAIVLARRMRGMRRKIDSAIFDLRTKEATVQRLKEKATVNAKKQESIRNGKKHRDQLLRKSIQNFNLNVKELMEERARIRSEESGFEQDLATAQQMEASTKLRVESIAAEQMEEVKRHKELGVQHGKMMDKCSKRKVDEATKTVLLTTDIKAKEKQRLEAWEQAVCYRQEEGHADNDDATPELVDDQPVPSIDIERIRATLNEDNRCFKEEQKDNDTLLVEVEHLISEVSRFDAEEETMRKQSELLRKVALKDFEVQKKRKQEFELFLANLGKDRRQVEKLRLSKAELEASLRELDAKTAEILSEQTQAFEKDRVALSNAKSQLQVQKNSTNIATEAWESQKKKNEGAINSAKEKVHVVKASFEQTRQQSEDLAKELTLQLVEAVNDMQKTGDTLVNDLRDEIDGLKKECPVLSKLSISTSNKLSTKEKKKETLSEIRSDCATRVENARKDREERLHALVHKRNERLKAEREEKENVLAERESELQAEREKKKDSIRAERESKLQAKKERKLLAEREEEEKESRKLERRKERNRREEEAHKRLQDEKEVELETEGQEEAKRVRKLEREKERRRRNEEKVKRRVESDARKGKREKTKRRHLELEDIKEDEGEHTVTPKRDYGSKRTKRGKIIPRENKTSCLSQKDRTSHSSGASSPGAACVSDVNASSSQSQSRRVRWEGIEYSNIAESENDAVCWDPNDGVFAYQKGTDATNAECESQDGNIPVFTQPNTDLDVVPFTQPQFLLSQEDNAQAPDPVEVAVILAENIKQKESSCTGRSKDSKCVGITRKGKKPKKSLLASDTPLSDVAVRSVDESVERSQKRSRECTSSSYRKTSSISSKVASVAESSSSSKRTIEKRSADRKIAGLKDKTNRKKEVEPKKLSSHTKKKRTDKALISFQASGIPSMEQSSSATVAGKSRRRKKNTGKTKAQAPGSMRADYNFHF